jgi:hypothetical protein
MGLPVDEMLLSEIDRVRPYRVYVFLNGWNVEPDLRRRVLESVRRPGVTAVWFHAAGYFDGQRGCAENVTALTGVQVVERRDAVVPELELAGGGHAWLADGPDRSPGAVRFGARLTAEQRRVVVGSKHRDWDTVMSPLFAVDDARATVLGRYVHDAEPGMALVEGEGWQSVYVGAPMLPGWLLRRIALSTGAHAWGPLGTVVHQRGPLVSVYAPGGGDAEVAAPRGTRLVAIEPAGFDGQWQPVGQAAARLVLPFGPGQTRFFRLAARSSDARR